MDGFLKWLNKPFDSGMTAANWFAFMGLLIACSMVWSVILRYLREV